MRLVKSDFGFGAGDPMVPALEYTGVLFAGSPLQCLTWSSFLPLAGDESTTTATLEQRADGVMEIAYDLGGVREPWSVEVTPTREGVEVEILAGGPEGWIEAGAWHKETELGDPAHPLLTTERATHGYRYLTESECVLHLAAKEPATQTG